MTSDHFFSFELILHLGISIFVFDHIAADLLDADLRKVHFRNCADKTLLRSDFINWYSARFIPETASAGALLGVMPDEG